MTSFAYAWIAHFGIASEALSTVVWVVETIFTLQIASKFMTSYIPEGELVPETSHANIARRYIAGEFWFDFLPWLPVFALVDNSRE